MVILRLRLRLYRRTLVDINFGALQGISLPPNATWLYHFITRRVAIICDLWLQLYENSKTHNELLHRRRSFQTKGANQCHPAALTIPSERNRPYADSFETGLPRCVNPFNPFQQIFPA